MYKFVDLSHLGMLINDVAIQITMHAQPGLQWLPMLDKEDSRRLATLRKKMKIESCTDEREGVALELESEIERSRQLPQKAKPIKLSMANETPLRRSKRLVTCKYSRLQVQGESSAHSC